MSMKNTSASTSVFTSVLVVLPRVSHPRDPAITTVFAFFFLILRRRGFLGLRGGCGSRFRGRQRRDGGLGGGGSGGHGGGDRGAGGSAGEGDLIDVHRLEDVWRCEQCVAGTAKDGGRCKRG